MAGVKIKVKLDEKLIQRAVEKGPYRNVFHAAASLSKSAKASIKRSKKPAAVGQPPHTRRGVLRRAIRFEVSADKKSAVIGPIASKVGTAGAAHESGGIYKGQRFDERPTMGPTLREAVPRFGGSFRGSFG